MKLGMSAAEIGAAMELLPALLSPVCHAAPRRELWPFGISGDLPILCCRADAAECLPLLRRFCLLKSCGAECELVYLSAEQGEYRQPLRRRVNEALAALGLEELAGSRGGVYFVPLSAAENHREPGRRGHRQAPPRAGNLCACRPLAHRGNRVPSPFAIGKTLVSNIM